jgi:phosphopentomutase
VPSLFSRIIVIVLDSVGAGALPDAGQYGDEGSDTLGNIARSVGLRLPTLRGLGLDRVVDIGGQVAPRNHARRLDGWQSCRRARIP